MAPLMKTKTGNHPRTPAIMFQGTCSNAGKSILAAAFCRIMLQDGYRVAPFKAQNLSLNSFVTHGGGEMGRAQVVQAQAARLDPDVRMNPILLKPNSGAGSQIILRGHSIGNITELDYQAYKKRARRTVRECYDSLSADYDAMVLEGAGSPAEVNLKAHDIVNMQMAKYAQAPVLLVGDIDRGGVFASFIGHMAVFTRAERALVAGYIINKLHGDAAMLGDALDYMLRRTGKPVLGVVNYLENIGLPEEDAVAFKDGLFDDIRRGEGVEIAVIDLPHISNFNDVEPFRLEPDVRLRIVRSAEDLHAPDAVILPGSKNVIGDLHYLRKSGLAERIMMLAEAGRTEIVGICGGFQMLGMKIADPCRIETEAGETLPGLGLLRLETVLEQKKTLQRTSARHIGSGLPVIGYEIHHGQSRGPELTPVFENNGAAHGAADSSGRIWGSYLHGLFDADPFRRWFIDRLRQQRGLAVLGAVQARYDLEPAFERLAEAVRGCLRVDEIYRRMGLK